MKVVFILLICSGLSLAVKWSPCPQIKPKNHGKDVHKLIPSDISIIAALGDSYTAANGAKGKTLFDIRFEDRGVSWSIGGENQLADQITLATIIKNENKNVYGYSTGTGNVTSDAAHLNIAIPSKTAPDLPTHAVMLVDRMNKAFPKGHDNLWKLVTIFIGGNDLCNSCRFPELFSAASYERNLLATVDYLRNNLKRVFVNLVGIMDPNDISVFTGPVCVATSQRICPCLYPPYDKTQVADLSKDYNSVLEKIAKTKRFNDKKDFAVVYQPLFKNFRIPTLADGTPDSTILAPDCFHLSVRGHGIAGVSLWNNMITPVGRKLNLNHEADKPNFCQSKKSPYFYTNKNSHDDDDSHESHENDD